MCLWLWLRWWMRSCCDDRNCWGRRRLGGRCSIGRTAAVQGRALIARLRDANPHRYLLLLLLLRPLLQLLLRQITSRGRATHWCRLTLLHRRWLYRILLPQELGGFLCRDTDDDADSLGATADFTRLAVIAVRSPAPTVVVAEGRARVVAGRRGVSTRRRGPAVRCLLLLCCADLRG